MKKYNIYHSGYKDIKAITLESSDLKVQFLPENGGKMASLFDKIKNMEFLTQTANAKYLPLKYDGNYVDSECSGFDDMLPTIDPSFYPSYPWAGTPLPDHGEVCGLPWQYEIKEDKLCMWVYGVRLPYKMEKCIYFENASKLKIEYKVTNLSSFELDFLWAAHTMINIEENGEILLPCSANSPGTWIFSHDKKFGPYGEKMTWPVARKHDGSTKNLSITPARNPNGNNYKFYLDKKLDEGYCGYHYKSAKTILRLLFPLATVPYFNLWVNEGSFHDLHNIALEPSTGSYDRVDLAKLHRQNSIIAPYSQYDWFLDFQIEHQ